MRKKIQKLTKISCFLSVNFLESLYSSRQRLYFFNSIFSKILSDKFCLMLKKLNAVILTTIRTTLHLFHIKMFLEAIGSHKAAKLKKFHQRRLEKLQKKRLEEYFFKSYLLNLFLALHKISRHFNFPNFTIFKKSRKFDIAKKSVAKIFD